MEIQLSNGAIQRSIWSKKQPKNMQAISLLRCSDRFIFKLDFLALLLKMLTILFHLKLKRLIHLSKVKIRFKTKMGVC